MSIYQKKVCIWQKIIWYEILSAATYRGRKGPEVLTKKCLPFQSDCGLFTSKEYRNMYVLKVSSFQKEFLVSLFGTKIQILKMISALASKKCSNQKTLLYNYVKYPLISDIKCLYFFFWPEFFLVAMAEIKNNFVRFLVQMRTRDFAFEINWPLVLSGTRCT